MPFDETLFVRHFAPHHALGPSRVSGIVGDGDPARWRRRDPDLPAPYLYSPQETAALMRATGHLRGLHVQTTYLTLIGLLAATGKRIGEAIDLGRDVLDAAPRGPSRGRSVGGRDRLEPHRREIGEADRVAEPVRALEPAPPQAAARGIDQIAAVEIGPFPVRAGLHGPGQTGFEQMLIPIDPASRRRRHLGQRRLVKQPAMGELAPVAPSPDPARRLAIRLPTVAAQALEVDPEAFVVELRAERRAIQQGKPAPARRRRAVAAPEPVAPVVSEAAATLQQSPLGQRSSAFSQGARDTAVHDPPIAEPGL